MTHMSSKDREDRIILYIDTLDNALIVTGWAADFVNATPLSSLYLSVNGQLLLCDYGQSRLDVAEYYGIEALENVGFSVMVPEELLSPGRENKLSFIMINSKKTGRYDSITYTLKIEN